MSNPAWRLVLRLLAAGLTGVGRFAASLSPAIGSSTFSPRSTAFALSDFIVWVCTSEEGFSLSGLADFAQTHEVCPWTGARRSALVRFDMVTNMDQLFCRCLQDRLEKLDRMHLVWGGQHLGRGVPAILESDRIGSRLTPADLGNFVSECKLGV